MFTRSERLFLRPLWPEDWAELHPLVDDEALARNLARVPWPYRADDARAFASLPQDPRHPHFLVTRPGEAGARAIGVVGFAECDGETELGYWIAQAEWGQGYATEAARAALAVARTLGHRRIVSGHFVDNPASGRVLAKLGFVRTGHARMRHSPARGRSDLSLLYTLDMVPTATGPGPTADRAPRELMRAA